MKLAYGCPMPTRILMFHLFPWITLTSYVPSKYPVFSALPLAVPDQAICFEALSIARKTRDYAYDAIKSEGEIQ